VRLLFTENDEGGGKRMRFFWGFLTAILVTIVVVVIFGVTSIQAGAMPAPAPYQQALINRIKLWFVPETSEVVAPPSDTEQAILEGGEHYNHHCAVCHDLSGDADSLLAESFHPQVADLTSNHVQAYSDEQLKWLVDNGIRYTGMPGWAKIVDDEAQWKIVYYTRVLDDQEQKEKYRDLLERAGKWTVGTPAAAHEHEEERESEESTEGAEETLSGQKNGA
jgi:mono/diheme cytochrome c family protein